MNSILSRIQDDLISFSNSISKFTGFDVLIADENLFSIATSDNIKNLLNVDLNNRGNLLKTTIDKGKVMCILKPKESGICRSCSIKDICDQAFQISMPIYFENKLIGVISLTGDDEVQKSKLKENIDGFKELTEQITQIVVSKAIILKNYEKNLELTSLFESIINYIEDGVIITDESLKVKYMNKYAKKILKLKNDNIFDLFINIKLINNENSHTDTYSIKHNDEHFEVTGKLYNINFNDWNKMLIFKDSRFIKQSILKSVFSSESGLNKIIGESFNIKKVKSKVNAIANSPSTVLIRGESGTGKELFARALHEESKRKDNLFVAINCAAIPENLLESELFGYVKGAFTGADPNGKAGKFELADGGTLFLDEIGDMPLHIQVKLLRVLEDKLVVRLGGHTPIKVNTRIVAATNKNLEEMVGYKSFREDLYYRLNVIPLLIPPLRKRDGDIKLLANYFLKKYSSLLEKKIISIDENFYDLLIDYSWPGNIRELQNTIEYVVNIMESPGYIDQRLLQDKLSPSSENALADKYNLEENEKLTIELALRSYIQKGYTRERIAEELGISVATLYRRLKKYKLN